MSGKDHLTIVVKVQGSMPRLSDPRIIDVVYKDDLVIIKAKEDIREDIASQLVNNNVALKEIKLEEESLEDLFLTTIYKVN